MKNIENSYLALNIDDPIRFMKFGEFEHIPTSSDYSLVYGDPTWHITNNNNNVVIIALEEPNCLCVNGPDSTYGSIDPNINKILSVCPYTTKYFNKIYNNNKRSCIWLPFNIKYIPAPAKKIYDVFYSGNILNLPFKIDLITKFNHCVVAFDGGTHTAVSYPDKLSLNAQSKISIVHNVLKIKFANVKTKYHSHQAFEFADTLYLAPQLKYRCIEAAVSKSLMLCYYDPFRSIERQFIPDVDFIYWHNESDLYEKINDILNNYEKYHPLIENAYNKVINNWTTKHFFDEFLKKL